VKAKVNQQVQTLNLNFINAGVQHTVNPWLGQISVIFLVPDIYFEVTTIGAKHPLLLLTEHSK
jgi:hypothetical protein